MTLYDVDAKALGKKLKTMRVGSGFKTTAQFAKHLKVGQTIIDKTEAGDQYCSIPTLIKWLEACGASMTFGKAESRDGDEIEIVHGFESYYRWLTQIIKSAEDFYIDGIHANLKAMARIAEEDREEESPPKPERSRASPSPLKQRRESSR